MKKSCYESRYTKTKKFITAAQYIAEFMTERYANSLKKNLPLNFWQTKEWKSFFLSQVTAANDLLKTYDAMVIMRTMKRSELVKIYSLRYISRIDLYLKKEQQSYNKELEDLENKSKVIKENDLLIAKKYGTNLIPGKKSLLGKLK